MTPDELTSEEACSLDETAQETTIAYIPVSHTVRTKTGGTVTLNITRGKAIKMFCTECLGWETHPNECTSPLCPLYPYRGLTRATAGNAQILSDQE